MLRISVDIGGTRSRVALIDDRRGIVGRRALPTPRADHANRFDELYAALLEGLAGEIAALRCPQPHIGESHSAPIGVALAGIVDPSQGTVVRSVNLPYCEGRPLAKDLALHRAAEVRLFTDIQAATWAEFIACSRPAVFGHLRLGTGVGYAEIRNGRFASLARAPGRHLDPLRLGDAWDRPCGCGSRGCLEAYVSRSALRAQAADNRIDARMIESALSESVGSLRRRLGDSALLVYGGGLIEEYPAIHEHLRGLCALPVGREFAELRAAQCGDDAGLLGAASLACAGSAPWASPPSDLPSASTGSTGGGGSAR
ncbi:MAG: ROK family protein [Phycisphaerales bacterium]|nr:ROK family protein [Phycisphaerales bacterium]